MKGRQSILQRLRSFPAATGAVAATEFSLVAPFLVALGLGSAETLRYLSIQNRVHSAAEAVAMMVSMADRAIDADHHRFIVDSTQLIVSEVAEDQSAQGRPWDQILQVSMASIRFEEVGGQRLPMVRWTVGERPCGEAPWTGGTSPSGLPSSFRGAAGGLVAVDVRYEYRPRFPLHFLPPRTIQRSAFLPPRYSDFVRIEWTPGSSTHRCQGY